MNKALFYLGLSCLIGWPFVALTQDRYVSPGGSNLWPYTDWSKAATSLHTAINTANSNNAGETVWVSNGLYSLSSVVYISNTIVRGAGTSASDVVVSGNGSSRCFWLRHENAALHMLTVSNGSSTTTDNGGAIRVSTGQVINSIIGWSFGRNGGGVAFIDPGEGVVSGCLFVANTANRIGGGLYLAGSAERTVANCRFERNATENETSGFYGGGAVYMFAGLINDSTLSSNFCASGEGGGGIYLHGGIVRSSLIESNSATIGGGVLSRNGTVLDSTIFANSTRSGIGGGTRCYDTILSNCLIEANTSASDGGGIAGDASSVWNCVIRGNSAVGALRYGGGIYIRNAFSLYNCIIVGNTSAYGGGAWLQNDALIRSCLIISNLATKSGGGLYMNSTSSVENCTIVGNSAVEEGAGIRFFSTTNNQTVRNTIVWFNRLTNGAVADLALSINSATNRFFNCCTATNQLPAGLGNITNDPVFVDLGNANYRLQDGSLCIDAGDNQDWMANAFDLDGFPRKDRFTRRVDIGAYEFMPNGILFMGR